MSSNTLLPKCTEISSAIISFLTEKSNLKDCFNKIEIQRKMSLEDNRLLEDIISKDTTDPFDKNIKVKKKLN